MLAAAGGDEHVVERVEVLRGELLVAAQPLQRDVVLVLLAGRPAALARNRSQFVPGVTCGRSIGVDSPSSSSKSV